MGSFNTEYILEGIADMEDGVYSMSDIIREEDISDETSKKLASIVKATGTVVGMDFANLGENGYDAYGVFNFLPDNKTDMCRKLSVVITLTDQVNSIGIYDMYQIINLINIRIPEGAFVLSADETTLYYRTYLNLQKNVSDEETLKNVGIRIFDIIACVTDWIDVFMGLNDGNMEYETCINRIKEYK